MEPPRPGPWVRQFSEIRTIKGIVRTICGLSACSLTFVVMLMIIVALTPRAAAQSGPPPIPKDKKFPEPSPLAVAPQEQVVSYWTTETGWSSELQLRNNSLQNLTVTPVLRLADGTETPLAAVTMKPEEAQSVDLGQAVAAANAAQDVGALGSLALRYVSPSQASLYAALIIRRPGHPTVFHVDAVGDDENMQTGGSEGIWWLPKSTTNGYLIVTNVGSHTVPAALSIYDATGRESRQNLSLPPHQNQSLFHSRPRASGRLQWFVRRHQNLNPGVCRFSRYAPFPLGRRRRIWRHHENVRLRSSREARRTRLRQDQSVDPSRAHARPLDS